LRNTATEAQLRATKPPGKRWSPSTLSAISLTLLVLFTLNIAPSVRAGSYPTTIVSVVTTDQGGNPRSDFSRGELVVVKVTLECPGGVYAPVSISFLQFVRVADPDLHMVYLGFMSSTISSGENRESASGYTIPSTAMTGTYKVKVMVSNTRPSDPQFDVLAEPEEASFTVS